MPRGRARRRDQRRPRHLARGVPRRLSYPGGRGRARLPCRRGRGLGPSLRPSDLAVPLLYLLNTLRHQGLRAPSWAPPVAGRGWPLPCCSSASSWVSVRLPRPTNSWRSSSRSLSASLRRRRSSAMSSLWPRRASPIASGAAFALAQSYAARLARVELCREWGTPPGGPPLPLQAPIIPPLGSYRITRPSM